jgi:hypothetical protein
VVDWVSDAPVEETSVLDWKSEEAISKAEPIKVVEIEAAQALFKVIKIVDGGRQSQADCTVGLAEAEQG